MKVIKANISVENEVDGCDVLRRIEKAGRTAYKSEERITDNSAKEFVKMIIQSGHHSVLEHYSISVRVVCDRGVSHEIVRHRIASYTQESTRYCNYSKDKFNNELTFIKPCFWDDDDDRMTLWEYSVRQAEYDYLKLIKLGAKPQEARSVLPNSLKTEIVMTMNLREWRTFLSMRTAKNAHPQMREIAIPILLKFKELIPVVFDDLNID